MSATTETDRIEAAGRKAGAAIWSAVEAAYDAGMNGGRAMRKAFEIALEALTEELPDATRPLFQASAYEAIPAAMSSADDPTHS